MLSLYRLPRTERSCADTSRSDHLDNALPWQNNPGDHIQWLKGALGSWGSRNNWLREDEHGSGGDAMPQAYHTIIAFRKPGSRPYPASTDDEHLLTNRVAPSIALGVYPGLELTVASHLRHARVGTIDVT